MPKGEPLKRTVTKDRWNKKAGYKTKGFNLRGDIADRFANVCEKTGRSQASVIMELMERYISENE
ncbi:MAG: chemotaxis protein [Lachnospiraceae bacterium]|nr:chemotaxis protein [Lachnospiraceae bacterium]